MKINLTPSKIFSPKKIHSQARNSKLLIEIIVVSLVLMGSFITLFKTGNYFNSNTVQNLKQLVSLKKPVKETKQISIEDKIRGFIDGKILKITSLEKTSQGDFIIESQQGTNVIISAEKDLEKQVRTLQTIVTKAKIENRQVILVDFRFEKLVVRYN